jgi:hypothetical protein
MDTVVHTSQFMCMEEVHQIKIGELFHHRQIDVERIF